MEGGVVSESVNMLKFIEGPDYIYKVEKSNNYYYIK